MEIESQLLAEVEELRTSGHQFLNGDISKNEFKGISGKFGVYAHRDGQQFMLRFRTFSGIIPLNHLKFIYSISKEYQLESIHLTTRQAVQLHGLTLDDTCEIIKKGIKEGLYTRGAGGNFPRNVALSPLAGVDPEEAFDPTYYAKATNAYFMEHILEYKLPRKLKVAYSNTSEDTAHAGVSDLGFIAVTEGGKKRFKVFVGGGLGRNSRLAVKLPKTIDPRQVLYYVKAVVDLFVAEGDFNNKGKARLRYVLERMGREQFLAEFMSYVKKAKKEEQLTLGEQEDEVIEGKITEIEHRRLFMQKQQGLYSVYFHPTGGILSLDILKKLIDKVEAFPYVEARLDMSEGFYLRHLPGNLAEDILKLTEGRGGETQIQCSTSCIGVPICQSGIAKSGELLRNIIKRFESKEYLGDFLPRLHISGCGNSCAVHEIAPLAFCGKLKRVNGESIEVFEIFIGGRTKEKAALGKSQGDIPSTDIPEFLFELAMRLEVHQLDIDSLLHENRAKLNALIKKYSV